MLWTWVGLLGGRPAASRCHSSCCGFVAVGHHWPIRYHLTPASNKDVSDAHPTAFTPAGYAFAIWGIIYTFGGVFTVSGRVDAAAMGGLSGLFWASWGPKFWK